MPSRNIADLDLRTLRLLSTLLQTRNVTRTAEQLSVAQSSVSKSLGALRDAFADPLFVRSARGLIPTPRALELAAPLASAIQALEALVDLEPFSPASEMTITVAATDYGQAVVVTPFIATLGRCAPQVRVRAIPLQRLSLETELASGAVDFGLGGQDHAPDTLISKVLFIDRFIAAMRKDHPAADRPMTLDLFCELSHALVATGAGTPFVGRTDAALADLGRKRRVVASVTGFLALPFLVRDSDLVAVAPECLFLHYGQELKLFVPPVDVPPLPMSLLWHERTQASRSHQWLRELLVTTTASRRALHLGPV